ncbi:lanthionine synthetase LanC family protein [Chitinophaga sp. CF418]|uniref:lanthionine synthetase LanC family protein n=1 Tax=Chitinophaga sp. CF418 TaxID=1855287 RepID=UPI0009108921|nr:lanthionine synthetase LanC family protein [Chitinophaga sp. CF418]SHM36805.1 Lanthionine synthetase C-like protein [Chitinophaga sp. CF418]
MVTQIPDRLLRKDDALQHVHNHVPASYPITYGNLREALCNNKKEGIKFIDYLIQFVEANRYTDISLLGRYILYSWTGISADKFSGQTDTRVFITDDHIAQLIQSCLHADENRRPDVQIILKALLSYKQDLIKRTKRLSSTPNLFTKDHLASFIQDGINELANPPIQLLAAAWKTGITISDIEIKTVSALSNIESQLETSSPGLYDGSHGIARNLAEAIEIGFLPAYPIYTSWINELLSKELDDYSLRQGLAGYGIANLTCSNFISPVTLDERLKKYTTRLSATRPDNSGFSTGLAGITYFLLSYAQHSGHKNALQAGLKNLISLTERASHNAGTTYWLSPNNEITSPWDENSAAHITLVFIKAYDLTGSIVYKRYVEAALYTHDIYATHDNLNQYAALGNILLNAHQSLKERMWLSRSKWIAQVMLQLTGKTELEKENMLDFLLNYYNRLS